MKTTLILALALLAPTLVLRAADTPGAPASPSVAKNSRCFELRTYTAAPGKFEALHARFRDHTSKLFVKHGMKVVGYWVPADADQGATNTLVYLLAHKSREAAKKSWDAFRNDPVWLKAKSETEVNGKLAEKVESVFLSATDYSPMK